MYFWYFEDFWMNNNLLYSLIRARVLKNRFQAIILQSPARCLLGINVYLEIKKQILFTLIIWFNLIFINVMLWNIGVVGKWWKCDKTNQLLHLISFSLRIFLICLSKIYIILNSLLEDLFHEENTFLYRHDPSTDLLHVVRNLFLLFFVI